MRKSIDFIPVGQKQKKALVNTKKSLLTGARDWNLQVNLKHRFMFLQGIVTTNLRPDMVLWSIERKVVHIIELTVPWETVVDESCERKKSKC